VRVVFALLAAVTLSSGAGAELRPPPGASSCAGCHGAGAAMGAIDGRPEAEIAAALAAYRSGERDGTVMGRIAKGFSEEESRAIAAYLARRSAE
jgi:cytochrome c553